MALQSLLEIIGYGAWNGGTLTDNSIFENTGMIFKNDVPVNTQTIEQRTGIRTRMVAPDDVRIGVVALEDLLTNADIDPQKIKIVIGATNVGEDKADPGPLVRHPFERLREQAPAAIPIDLYAGCPGFNVAVELIFVLSGAGILQADDLAVVIGAENIHRAKAFKPNDTAGIIFGDDALATALRTTASVSPQGRMTSVTRDRCRLGDDFISDLAAVLQALSASERIDGIIIDNQLGRLEYRVPATAARVQHRLAQRMHPQAVADGLFDSFKTLMEFYDRRIDSFAYDIMSLSNDPELVRRLAAAYVQSGKYGSVAAIHLGKDRRADITVYRGVFSFDRPQTGIVDTRTRTHGCFGHYIEALTEGEDVFGAMDGKGVFMYATRGARKHLGELLTDNRLSLDELDLLVEHQANFAMLPITLEQVMADRKEPKEAARDYIANRMVTNIHARGNCSVVCMQRLPYDLQRGALSPDEINGYAINRNLSVLQGARTILNDSVGAGMTRSSFLQRLA